VIPGQKFTMDKVIHLRTSVVPQPAGDDENFSWKNATTKLKGITDMAVVCQKGQKSASDPTPNQDNFFVTHVGPATMYGVADGHGPFGHLVSFRLVQTLPYFLAKSPHANKDWEAALKEAFLSAQQDLEEFCSSQNINIQASGAAGSVLVLEEQTVHIAFIGDARLMLASWNRRDSRLIFASKDHKPDLPEEKARLEAAGSEVREINPGNHRIYLPSSNFPGLTMSRAFGDTACKGVLREPEYHKFLMQPTDQWYAIVASDGIWEFMEGEEVCNLTAKKLRLKGPRETLHFLVNASRKRWAHVCGDYCDDITGILIQWNASDSNKEGTLNHSLTVKRPTK
jgi:serine/threonine protein phosphatase PrpC